MKKEQILSQWSKEGYNDEAALIRWNKDAPKYGAMALPKDADSLAMRIMHRENMIEPGTTGLDVGCGGGRFSLALQKLGMQMHGTDFSPNMIREARKRQKELRLRSTFSVDNWHSLSLAEKGWEKQFDLVLAHMTPAVIDAASFLRLVDASRGWVLMLKPTRWQTPILEELQHVLQARPEESTLDSAFCDAFSLAWLEGYSPRTEYDQSIWTSDLTIDEAVDYYGTRLPRSVARTEGTKAQIRSFLETRFPEGRLQDETHTQIAALYFHV